MRCRSAQILLTQQLRETLPPEQTAGLSRHFIQCPRCRAEQRGIADLAAQLVDRKPSPVPLERPLTASGWTERLARDPDRPASLMRQIASLSRWAPVASRSGPSSHAGDDLSYLNADSLRANRRWTKLSPDGWDTVEARVRHGIRVRDDFVQIVPPLIVGASDRAVVAAVEQYKREAAIVDARLVREVTCAFKATALSDICDHLRADTGISLTAGPSVGDEKVSLFCEKLPLREVMRQMSRPFGYAWLRSKKEGEYRYELVQDLRSQLLDEEVRNRDRNAALLALDQEIERYRPYLHLSPDEALARLAVAPPGEKKLLEQLSSLGWGPLQMYVRLSPPDQAALRAGQELWFSAEPNAGERPLPSDVGRGVLQGLRHLKIRRLADGHFGLTTDPEILDARPPAAVPEARAIVTLKIRQSELGQFTLAGESGFYARSAPGSGQADTANSSDNGPLAVGTSPAVRKPENSVVNAAIARDSALQPRVTVAPVANGPWPVARGALSAVTAEPSTTVHSSLPTAQKVTTAEVLEALHRATGLPVVADAYTRLYPPGAVTVRNRPLFDALNQIADSMRMQWNKEGKWLRFRSTSYYDDRLKEVPNRLLNRWAMSRRQLGSLTLDDLVEISQLADAQLDGEDMAEGARERFGLAEWDLPRNWALRRHLRYLAEFSPAQRQEATSPAGLPFTKMSLAQQQRFLSFALDPHASGLRSLVELDGAVLRVDYSQPGWFEWRVPGGGADWLQWVMPVGPDRRAPRPPIRERTRPAALAAALHTDPKLREAMLRVARHLKPRLDPAQLLPQEAQIVPTELNLTILYVPGASHERPVWWFSVNNQTANGTWPPE